MVVLYKLGMFLDELYYASEAMFNATYLNDIFWRTGISLEMSLDFWTMYIAVYKFAFFYDI